MHFNFLGANDAFRGLIEAIQWPNDVPQGLKTHCTSSRAGDVKQVDEPVIVTYTHPLERVLFNPARDANPFFHLYESIWMLAGCCDAAPLAYFNSQIAEIASDDGQTFNGAYGHRWRNGLREISLMGSIPSVEHPNCSYGYSFETDVDQLQIIVDQLKRKPESRRCVLQMWTVHSDLLRMDTTKDTCCNTHAYFSICDGQLDMTVCNRSNDMIWGMLGANVVHFSFLQEYMAACIGVEVGVYNQFTNNLHVYTERWEPEKWLAAAEPRDVNLYDGLRHFPLVKNPAAFDRECAAFIEAGPAAWLMNWSEPFLHRVVAPMCWAFKQHKDRDYAGALNTIDLVGADDWCKAGREWLLRRKANWEAKHVSSCAD
jgi:thymidylate synthase